MRTSSVADTEPKGRGLGWVVRRLLLYIGLAFASLTVFVLFFALTIRLGVTDKINGWFKGGWIGFLAFTALLFWITVRQSVRRWRHWSFWLALSRSFRRYWRHRHRSLEPRRFSRDVC